VNRKSLYILSFFVTVWMVPLFFPVASLVRYAFEELRVLVTGILVGWLLKEREEE